MCICHYQVMPGGTLTQLNAEHKSAHQEHACAKLHLTVCAYAEYRALLMKCLGQHTTSPLMLTQRWAS